MFSLFHTIFIKITSVVASAIIAIGLVSIPQVPNEIYKVHNEGSTASSSINQEIQIEENHEIKSIITPQQTPTTNKNKEQETSNLISTTTEVKISQPEKIDPNKTKYIYVTYRKYEGDKFICDGYIDSEAKGISGTSYCPLSSQLVLNSYGNSKAVLYIKILNSDRQSLWHKKVLVTTYDGTIRTEKETNENGVVEVEIYSPNVGNGYATIRTDDDYARDVNFYVSSDKVQTITNFQCNPPEIVYSKGAFRSSDPNHFTCSIELRGDQGQLLNDIKEILLEYWAQTGLESDKKYDYKKSQIKTNNNEEIEIKPDINTLKSWMMQNNIRQRLFNYKIRMSVDGVIKESSLDLTIVND